MSKLSFTLIIVLMTTLLSACGSSGGGIDDDKNLAPTAVLGDDINIIVGEEVLLDGRDSFDPEGRVLSYRWQLLSKPVASSYEIPTLHLDDPSIRFVPSAEGQYVFMLTVSDGKLSSRPEQINVNVTAPYTKSNTEIKPELVLSHSCSDYLGRFDAHTLDTKSAMSYVGELQVTMQNGNCIFTAFGIPSFDVATHQITQQGFASRIISHERETFASATSSAATLNIGPVVMRDSQLHSLQQKPITQGANTTISVTTNAVFLNGLMIDNLCVNDSALTACQQSTKINNTAYYQVNLTSLIASRCTVSRNPVIGFTEGGAAIVANCTD